MQKYAVVLTAWLAMTAILPKAYAAQTCVSPAVSGLQIGVNITHGHLISGSVAQCSPEARKVTISRQDSIILNYAAERTSTQETMSTVVAGGALDLRTVIWVWLTDIQGRPPEDRIGSASVVGGALSPGYLHNLRLFVEDAKAAGFKRLILAFGPQGKANPTCRVKNWGDCYDVRAVDPSWAALSAIVVAVPDTPGMQVVFDISNEACPSVTNSNVELQAGELLRRFVATYPRRSFTISCAADNARQVQRKLQAVTRLFASVGVNPAFLDIHMYFTANEAAVAAAEAERIAQNFGVPWIVGEIPPDSPAIPILAELKQRQQIPLLNAILTWPKRYGSACDIDLEPGVAMSSLAVGLGVKTPGGARMAACR